MPLMMGYVMDRVWKEFNTTKDGNGSQKCHGICKNTHEKEKTLTDGWCRYIQH